MNDLETLSLEVFASRLSLSLKYLRIKKGKVPKRCRVMNEKSNEFCKMMEISPLHLRTT